MKTFNSETLGIDEREFVLRTNSTFKLGIRFTDWGAIGDDYLHGFGTIGRGLGPLPFHQFWLKRFPAGTPLDDIAYAYHLDAVLYAGFL